MSANRSKSAGDQVLTNRIHQIAPALLGLSTSGTVYDLSSGWWPGMPLAAAHPPFQVHTYRTPRSMRNEKALTSNPQLSGSNYGFISEVVSTTMHAGTHLDALCHVTSGPDDSWYGGHSADKYLGDFGATRDDASSLPPYLTRGVLLDVATAFGVEVLPDGFAIGAAELEKACERQTVEVRSGDTVLIRTGMMRDWPDKELMTRTEQPGLSLDGARWLYERGPVIVGADNTSVEVSPSGHPSEPQPVHQFLLHDQGVLLLEWVYLEDLAAAGIGEFLFVASPLGIVGATGSLVRPLAIT